MRVSVETERCQGHALCIAVAPQLFQLDEVGYNATPPQDVAPDDEAAAREAADSCPERAIRLEA